MRSIIIDKGTLLTRMAILQDEKLVDFRMETYASESQVGRIFKGRVTDVIPGMDAAFVDIGLGKNAYLGKMDVLKDGLRGLKKDRISDLIKTGEEILVEVIKDASGTKGAKVSMRLSLSGKSMVLMPNDAHVGISRKVEDLDQRARLSNWVEGRAIQDFGLIIRTSAAYEDEETLSRELEYLSALWDDIKSYKVLGKAPKCIYKGMPFVLSVLQDEMKQTVDRIQCNDPILKNEIEGFLKRVHSTWSEKLTYYKDQMPIFSSFKIEAQLSKMLSRRIELSGGAYLIIDETEALTVIDVNSGQLTGKTNMDQTAFKVNKKAAIKVADLIKVREFSGIILIDFIDMTDKDMKTKLVKLVERLSLSDRNRVTVHGLTKLGILEMTRKKSVDSIISRTKSECKNCEGSGVGDNAHTQLEAIMRDLKYFRHHTDEDAVLFEVNDAVNKLVCKSRVEIAEALETIGFDLVFAVGENPQYKRIKAGSKEKLIDFAKKTGYLQVNNI